MNEPVNLDKYIYTTINLLNHLNFGLTFSCFGPTYVDFKYITNSNMSYIGLFPSVTAIACIIGSFFGFLYKYVNRQLTLSLLISLQGLATILMPYSVNVWQLYSCIFIYGLGIGAWNNSNNVILIEIWHKRSPSVLQFSQFIYGLGTFLGPLIVGGYLSGEIDYKEQQTFNNGTVVNVWTDELINRSELNRREQLKLAYLIAGSLQCIGPVLMFTMYFIRRYNYEIKSEHSVEESLSLIDSKDRNRRQPIDNFIKKSVIICISIFLAFGIMSENMYMDFSSTFFQFIKLRLNARKAAEIFATMSIALSTGRAISVIIAMKLRPQTMISYQIFIVFIGFLYQYFGQYSLTNLWISSLVICFGYSSIFICLFSFVGQYIPVTDRIGAIFIASYNFVYLFLPFFLGTYIEVYPNTFLYIEFSSLCIGICSFITVLIIVRKVPAYHLLS